MAIFRRGVRLGEAGLLLTLALEHGCYCCDVPYGEPALGVVLDTQRQN